MIPKPCHKVRFSRIDDRAARLSIVVICGQAIAERGHWSVAADRLIDICVNIGQQWTRAGSWWTLTGARLETPVVTTTEVTPFCNIYYRGLVA